MDQSRRPGSGTGRTRESSPVVEQVELTFLRPDPTHSWVSGPRPTFWTLGETGPSYPRTVVPQPTCPIVSDPDPLLPVDGCIPSRPPPLVLVVLYYCPRVLHGVHSNRGPDV